VKKVKDERLKMQNLKHIRIAYIVQTIGILGILGYDLVTTGLEGMRENPLWIVFMISTVIAAYLSMSISVDHEGDQKDPRKGLMTSVMVVSTVTIVIGILVPVSSSSTSFGGVVIGGIIFICGIAPAIYVYQLRKKRQDEYMDN
jgi:4-hydroxybenzoate polyprenyltransferase